MRPPSNLSNSIEGSISLKSTAHFVNLKESDYKIDDKDLYGESELTQNQHFHPLIQEYNRLLNVILPKY